MILKLKRSKVHLLVNEFVINKWIDNYELEWLLFVQIGTHTHDWVHSSVGSNLAFCAVGWGFDFHPRHFICAIGVRCLFYVWVLRVI